MRLTRAFLVLGGVTSLSACAGPLMGPGHMGAEVMAFGQPSPAQPSPVGRGVALLAPLTGLDAGLGPALVDAARLGLGTGTEPPLAVFDTGSTAAGAPDAARRAILQGAGLILGPLTGPEAAAVAPITQAAHVDVLAFTSDQAVSRPGLWPLGITPAEQVTALVQAAHGAGRDQIAALLPLTPLGDAMAQALEVAEPSATVQRYYDFPSMNAAARSLSDYMARRGAVDAELKRLEAAHSTAALAEAARLQRRPVPPPPFDALVVAETGTALSELSSLLLYYDAGPGPVLILGPGLWAADPAAVAAAGLSGALYAAPDPAAGTNFLSRYALQNGGTPPSLATVAFDAGAIARVATEAGGINRSALTSPAGFSGADGVLGLAPDGAVDRGLAVFRITPGGAQIIRPAPAALPAPGL